MKVVFNYFLSLFFPDTCIICQNRICDTEKHICISCISQLPKTNYHNQPDNRLVDLFAGRFPFNRAFAFTYFIKEGSMQKVVHELKYKNNPGIGLLMGSLFGNDIKDSDPIREIDLIIPIPLHPKRQKQRGYNQSEEIAKGIAEQIGIDLNTTTLVRTVNNPSQTRNNRIERWKNVEDIFSVIDVNILVNKHILLVDDVITTGSTIEACAKELLKCEGIKISIASLAIAI